MEAPLISGIASQRDEAKLTIRRIPDQPGVAHKVLGPISDAHINVDVIIQNASEKGFTDLTFTVPRGDFETCHQLLQQLVTELGAQDVKADNEICKISIVGIGMRSHSGVANLMFRTLAENDINIQMISTSEIKVSVIIDEAQHDLAVQSLHRAFALDKADK